MKAVDWVMVQQDKICFVELKDLDASVATRHDQRSWYLGDLEAGRKDDDLVRKFRDSFIYQWAIGKVDKPIVYLVVIACCALDCAMLTHRADALRRKLPSGVPDVWKRGIAADVLVLNERTWNDQFGNFPMVRIPEEQLK